jgi:hypothetical protein
MHWFRLNIYFSGGFSGLGEIFVELLQTNIYFSGQIWILLEVYFTLLGSFTFLWDLFWGRFTFLWTYVDWFSLCGEDSRLICDLWEVWWADLWFVGSLMGRSDWLRGRFHFIGKFYILLWPKNKVMWKILSWLGSFTKDFTLFGKFSIQFGLILESFTLQNARFRIFSVDLIRFWYALCMRSRSYVSAMHTHEAQNGDLNWTKIRSFMGFLDEKVTYKNPDFGPFWRHFYNVWLVKSAKNGLSRIMAKVRATTRARRRCTRIHVCVASPARCKWGVQTVSNQGKSRKKEAFACMRRRAALGPARRQRSRTTSKYSNRGCDIARSTTRTQSR